VAASLRACAGGLIVDSRKSFAGQIGLRVIGEL
jgi:hypothetical protein